MPLWLICKGNLLTRSIRQIFERPNQLGDRAVVLAEKTVRFRFFIILSFYNVNFPCNFEMIGISCNQEECRTSGLHSRASAFYSVPCYDGDITES
jgi:hypothetical protein